MTGTKFWTVPAAVEMNNSGVACALLVHDLWWTPTKFRGPSRGGHDFDPAMNIMMSTRHRATCCRRQISELVVRMLDPQPDLRRRARRPAVRTWALPGDTAVFAVVPRA